MTYALVDNPDSPTVIQEVRGPRREETKLLDGTTLRRPADGWTDLQLRRCGLLPVATVPKPADTATTTHDLTVELVSGVPTQVWTERPKTQAELDAEADAARFQRAEQARDWVAKTRARNAITAGEVDDDTALTLASLFDAWSPDAVDYAVDDVVRHDEKPYQCLQAHTSQADWAPDVAVSLWVRYRDPAALEAWVQPTGGHDAYAAGERVSHNGNVWTSLVDANVWEPTAANSTLWRDDGAA